MYGIEYGKRDTYNYEYRLNASGVNDLCYCEQMKDELNDTAKKLFRSYYPIYESLSVYERLQIFLEMSRYNDIEEAMQYAEQVHEELKDKREKVKVKKIEKKIEKSSMKKEGSNLKYINSRRF